MTVHLNPELQHYILVNSASAQNGVPHIVYDQTGKKDFSFEVTGPFTKFDSSDARYVGDTAADTASMVSTNAGRVSAVAGAMASFPTPSQPGAVAVGTTATIIGLVASAIEQILRPNPGQFAVGLATDIAAKPVLDRFPLYSPVINEVLELFKNSGAANQIQDSLNRGYR
ncbi:hypothetical protein [Burkholderia pseudomultivorans]|nr:hypothetical protein [Burkholderia pseudomultivorans]